MIRNREGNNNFIAEIVLCTVFLLREKKKSIQTVFIDFHFVLKLYASFDGCMDANSKSEKELPKTQC